MSLPVDLLALMSMRPIAVNGDAFNMAGAQDELFSHHAEAGPSPMAMHTLPLDRRRICYGQSSDSRPQVRDISSTL